jgi:hypothetical protein
MTSRERTPSRSERSLDLGEELVRRDAEAQERQAEHERVGEGEVVLTQCVTDHVSSPGVLDAVDLDHHTPVGPDHVEVVETIASLPHHLATGCRETTPATLPGELELPE